uniref:neuralized-like protein 4 isoform X2 n=1 Tax=Myxine glutinosa TaxID=7769 RepID=UPI00358F8D8A
MSRHGFHGRCGECLLLDPPRLSACRLFPLRRCDEGVAFGERPVRPCRPFLVGSWTGSLAIGLTAVNPVDLVDIPAIATSLQKSWVVSGSTVFRNGVVITETFGPPAVLDCLSIGDVIGVELRPMGQENLTVGLGVNESCCTCNGFGVVCAACEAKQSSATEDSSGRFKDDVWHEREVTVNAGETHSGENMEALDHFVGKNIDNRAEHDGECCVGDATDTESGGAMHIWLNGRDLGSAASGLPSRAWAVVDVYGKCTQVTLVNSGEEGEEDLRQGFTMSDLRFHSRCGSLARLSEDFRTAQRHLPTAEFNHGVVLSYRPLFRGEMFQVRIEQLVEKWSGSLELGVTTHNPDRLAFPPTMSNITSGTVLMSDCGILTNGKGTRLDYSSTSLDSLQPGDVVGLTVRENGNLHFFINKVDQGVAAHDMPSVVYGVIDLYGRTAKVALVCDARTAEASDHCPVHLEEDFDAVPGDHPVAVLPTTASSQEPLRFHDNCGQSSVIMNEGQTALRLNALEDFNHGVALTSRQLGLGERFEVRLDDMVSKWAGSIEIGVTTHDPTLLQLPSTMTNLQSGTWMVTGNGMMRDGFAINNDFGHNLDRLQTGDRVGVTLFDDGSLHLIVNGEDLGAATLNVPPNVWGVVDLYGQAVQVTLITPGDLLPPPLDSCKEHKTNDPPSPLPRSVSPTIQPLCFHRLHGSNAVISRGGQTAFRRHALAEFNNAIVVTSRTLWPGEICEIVVERVVGRWSGSLEIGVTTIPPSTLLFPPTMTDLLHGTWMLSGTAVMRDGVTTTNSYPANLDNLEIGSRVALSVSTNGELHYYFNGEDQGVACTGVPQNVYAAVDLYGQCVQVSLTSVSVSSGDGLSTSLPGNTGHFLLHRFHGHGDGQVRCPLGALIGSHGLEDGEVFEMRVDEVHRGWAGSLAVGVTSVLPSDPGLATLDLRALCKGQGKVSGFTWLVAGGCEVIEVKAVSRTRRRSYGRDLYRLQVGSRVGLKRRKGGTLHLLLDGDDQGPALGAIPSGVRPLVLLSSRVTAVTAMSRSYHLNNSRSSQPSTLDLDTLSGTPVLSFCDAGISVRLSHEGRTSQRISGYSSYLVTKEPLLRDHIFQVQIDRIAEGWDESLGIGVVVGECGFQGEPGVVGPGCELWIFQGRALYHNGFKVFDGVGADLSALAQGSSVGVSVDEEGVLHLSVNGRGVHGPEFERLGSVEQIGSCMIRGAVVMYGRCEQVTIIENVDMPAWAEGREKADIEDGVKEGVLSRPISSLVQCDFQAACTRFKDLLTLPDAFFADGGNCACYCDVCASSSSQGSPPPHGWCTYMLRHQCGEDIAVLRQWLVAYHGTSVRMLRRILDRGEIIAACRSPLWDRDSMKSANEACLENGDPDAWERLSDGPMESPAVGVHFDSLCVSPSLQTVTRETFCSRMRFRDRQSRRVYHGRVALVVLVRPGSFCALETTSEPKWLMKERGGTVLSALLIRVE